MNKAILILDKMPENCMECPLRFKDGDTDDWFRFRCHMSKDQVKKGERLENCPLKPLPQYKKSLYLTDNKSIMISQPSIYESGWNDCLNEILGGNDE